MKIQTFDYSVDLLQAILWQYNEAINLQSLLTQKQEWYNINQSDFWSNWYTNVFDLRTANFFGLSVWSYILKLPLFVPINPEPIDKPIWGFNAYDPTFPDLENTYLNFENGNFSTLGKVTTLTLEEQRFILRLRYFQLVSNGTIFTQPEQLANNLVIPGINAFLDYLMSTSNLDPTGQIWALDGLDMTMTYVFTFSVSVNLRKILVAYDLLPRPAGVGIKYIMEPDLVWGFGPFNQNFGNGTFITPFI